MVIKNFLLVLQNSPVAVAGAETFMTQRSAQQTTAKNGILGVKWIYTGRCFWSALDQSSRTIPAAYWQVYTHPYTYSHQEYFRTTYPHRTCTLDWNQIIYTGAETSTTQTNFQPLMPKKVFLAVNWLRHTGGKFRFLVCPCLDQKGRFLVQPTCCIARQKRKMKQILVKNLQVSCNSIRDE